MNFKSFVLILFVFFAFSCSLQKNKNKSDGSSKWSQLISQQLKVRWHNLEGTDCSWNSNTVVLARAIYLCNEKENYQFLKNYSDGYVDSDGKIKGYKADNFDLNAILNGRNLCLIYQKTQDIKYKKAIEILVNQIKKQPRTKEGGLGLNKNFSTQLSLESAYMVCPFLVEYAVEFNQNWAIGEAIKQITLIYKHNLDPKTGLLYHAWDASQQSNWCDPVTGQSHHFWSRSMGLYCMSIVDVLDYLPENNPGRKPLVEILQNTSKAILKVQDTESGLWYQVLNMGEKEGNYLETSGTAEFAYVFAKGYKKGYLSNIYWNAAQKAFNGITDKMVEKDGAGNYNFTHISGPCNLGDSLNHDGSYKYYITEKVILNAPEGLAPFLLASKELFI